MSTSADALDDRPLRDGAVARFRALPYDDPVAQYLVGEVQQEYVQRYGGPDEAVVDPGEFLPPHGLFLVAEVDGEPAGCGAWRALRDGVAEIKRVYVAPRFRRRGLAQEVVARLERSAAAAGHRTVVLNTGDRQPEAIALYSSSGYRRIPDFGYYKDEEGVLSFARDL
jgi:GNAT superfamily N-acetyltransferase